MCISGRLLESCPIEGDRPVHKNILQGRQTRGTETSKYPEENKTNVIPLVAASEKGLAQTNNVSALLGL